MWVFYCKAEQFVRTEKTIYHTVIIWTDTEAHHLIASLEHRQEFAVSAVRTLYLGGAVQESPAARILDVCQGVTNLMLNVTTYSPLAESRMLAPLQALPLTCLSMTLSALFHRQRVRLPNLQITRRITHLHLADSWVSWEGVTVGLTELTQLSHLSLRWSMYNSNFDMLREVLRSTNLKVLVLWKREYAPEYDELVRCLSREGLEDRRVVFLDSRRYEVHLNFGGFWEYAEDLVKWREEVDGMSLSPLQVLASR